MTAQMDVELPDLESDTPDWALELILDLPDSFKVMQPVALRRDTDAVRAAEALKRAQQHPIDWDLARRRILSRLLADGPYAGTQHLRIDFWRRRAILESIGNIATALYQGQEGRLPDEVARLRAVDLQGLPFSVVSIVGAADLAAKGSAVLGVLSLIIAGAREHCTETRGSGAAVSVERLASTWATDVIVECLDQARRANAPEGLLEG